MTPWYYVLGFAVFAWASLTIGSVIKAGPASTALNWMSGTVAAICALIAGAWATSTWIYNVTGAITGIHPVVALVSFAVVLVLLIATVPALLLDRISAVAVTPLIVGAWVVLPSVLDHGVIPGTGGAAVTSTVRTVAAFFVANTGWFG